MNISDSDARFLVQLLTYHALLQRPDMPFENEEFPIRLLAATRLLSDLYMAEILDDGNDNQGV